MHSDGFFSYLKQHNCCLQGLTSCVIVRTTVDIFDAVIIHLNGHMFVFWVQDNLKQRRKQVFNTRRIESDCSY